VKELINQIVVLSLQFVQRTKLSYIHQTNCWVWSNIQGRRRWEVEKELSYLSIAK